MWERILVILRKELIQALREPRMRVLLFVPPMVQLIVFGYAVNLDVDHARIAWMDMDRTPRAATCASASRVGPLRRGGTAAQRRRSAAGARPRRGAGRGARAARFERDLERGRPTEVQVLIDGTNSNTASLVSSYARRGDRGLFERCDGRAAEHAHHWRASPGGRAECRRAAGDGAHAASGSIPTCTAATTSCPAWWPTSS